MRRERCSEGEGQVWSEEVYAICLGSGHVCDS